MTSQVAQVSSSLSRRKGALLASLVADAATLGTHWIYDPAAIPTIAGDKPEFHAPNAKEYVGVPAYFAHAGKSSGDLTMYGEQLRAAINVLTDEDAGSWSPELYLGKFALMFDRGGEYNGYIDGMTNKVLDNIKAVVETAHAEAMKAAASLDDKQAVACKNTISKLVLQCRSAEDVVSRFLKAVEGDVKDADVAKAYAAAFVAARKVEELGHDDAQINGFVKLPAVVIANYQKPADELALIVEKAVRITNNNNECVQWSVFAAKVLQNVLQGQTIPDGIKAAVDAFPEGENKAILQKAISDEAANMSAIEIGSTFGLPCPCVKTIPASVAILMSKDCNGSFEKLNRLNINVGGDQAGRAIFIGAVYGAAYGVEGIPLSWVARLNKLRAIGASLDQLQE